MPPRKILLATDLSPRCDRAFDRAVMLMKEFNSELIALHVVEPQDEISGVRRIPFLPVHRPVSLLVDRAKRQLSESINRADINASVIVTEGNAGEIILRTAREKNCDLIMTGVVRKRILDNFVLGRTIKYLLRKSEKPLLVVNGQVGSSYKKILVSVDYSEASKYAIATAAGFFPERYLSLFHAYNAPASYAADDVDNYNRLMRPAMIRNFNDFLSKVDLTLQQRENIQIILEWGVLTNLLRDLVTISGTELVVTGSRKRGMLLNALFTGNTRRIMSSLTCDILVARRPFLLGR